MTWGGLPDNPFVGLRPFESDENLLFFGREEQTGALLKRLHHTGFVAVVGSSGSGKSSLVRAGLIPKLEGGFLVADRDRWHVAIMKPGDALLSNLAEALLKVQAAGDGQQGGQDLREAIELSGVRAVRETLAPLLEDTNANLLLVVDQFEEIFRFRDLSAHGAQHDEAADFVQIMLDLAEQRELPVYVVMTMRSDFLGDCDVFHGLPEALNRSQYLVPRLTRRQLQTAIEGPIHLYQGAITRTLVDRFLNDAGRGHDQLPVIQHALNRTWARWHHEGAHEGSLDVAHYEAIGTLAHALDWHAEKAYAELGVEGEEPSRKQVICEIIFKALTDKGPEARGVRRPTRLGTLCALAEASEEEVIAVIDVFRKPSRSFLMPPIAADLTAETVIDLSHESLMRVWERLIKWVDDEAESGRIYQRLAERAEDYKADKASLLSDGGLRRAVGWQEVARPNETWARRYHPAFDQAMAFLEESKAERARLAQIKEAERLREVEREKELAAERARAKEQRKRFRVAAVLALLAVGLAVLALLLWFNANTQRAAAETARQDAVREKEEADRQRLLADSNATVAQLERMAADEQRELAQANFLEAEEQRQIAERLLNEITKARDDLQVALEVAEAQRQEAERQRAIAEEALDEAEAQRQIAENERLKTFGLSLASRAMRGLPQLDIAKRNALLAREAFLFNRDSGGDFISEVYDALRTTLNNVSDFQNMPQRGGPTVLGFLGDAVWAVAYSPDGRWIATSGRDGTLYLRGAGALNAEPIRLRVPSDPANPIARPLAFSPDGLLASVGDRASLRLWNTDGGDTRGNKLQGNHPGEVRALAFNRDGATLASAGDGGAVRLWTNGTQKTALRDHTGAVHAVAFSSADASLLATAGKDGTVRLWNADTGALLHALPGHRGAVRAAAFSPTNGALLATAGDDGLVRLWDAVRGEGLVVLRGHVGPVNVVAFSPDGTRLASGGGDKQVRLWDVSDLSNLTNQPLILEGHTGGVRSLAFSPDSTTLVSGGADRTVLQWNIDVEALAEAVCEAVGYENLSPEDWDTYLPGVAYRETCPTR